MIIGIGVDILHLQRLRGLLHKRGMDGFAKRILSPHEHHEMITEFDVEKNYSHSTGTNILNEQLLTFFGVRYSKTNTKEIYTYQ